MRISYQKVQRQFVYLQVRKQFVKTVLTLIQLIFENRLWTNKQRRMFVLHSPDRRETAEFDEIFFLFSVYQLGYLLWKYY